MPSFLNSLASLFVMAVLHMLGDTLIKHDQNGVEVQIGQNNIIYN